MNLGAAIKNLRKESNLSQVELAEKTGLSQTSISLIEKGYVTPTQSNLAKIAKELKVAIPIIHLMSIEETDVPIEKRQIFNDMMPSICKLIKKLTT